MENQERGITGQLTQVLSTCSKVNEKIKIHYKLIQLSNPENNSTDEGSMRRRPRGFKRKQQIKAYTNSSNYYPNANYESPPPVTVTDMNCYPSHYAPYEYGHAPSQPAVSSGNFQEWQQYHHPDYHRTSPPQSGIMEYAANYQVQNYHVYENPSEFYPLKVNLIPYECCF